MSLQFAANDEFIVLQKDERPHDRLKLHRRGKAVHFSCDT
jgi:hypothetical protein